MSIVSANNQTTYANAKQVWTKPVLNVEPLSEIASATISDVPAYPIEQLFVTSTSPNWLDGKENMLFRVERPDGRVVAWGVLNRDNTGSSLYPDVKSDGDFGYATNEGLEIIVNDILRVYSNRPNWAMISRVTPSGIQRKRWNRAYTNEGSTPPPVAIMGHDLQADVDTTTNLATFSFDASNSYGWTSGETITTFAYTLPAGAVVTGGAVNTDSVTFTIPAGIYTVQLDITSSTGITRSGFRTIYANDTGSNKSFGENFPIESIQSDNTDINGWSGQFTVLGDVSSVVYPGCKCHWYAPVYYDNSRLTDNNAFIDVFIGYLSEIRVTTDSNQIKRTNLTFLSPLKIAQLLPSATQTFEEVPSPSTWTEVAPGLSDPAYAGYYILQYHTTMLDNHDYLYETAIRDLRRRVFGFPADNIAAQLTIVGQIMRGDIGCRSDGTVTLTQEPSLKSNDDRNALDSKYTWTEESVRDRLSLGIRFRPQIAYIIMAAVAYDGNRKKPMIAYASKAPGNAQAQGITKSNIPDISITAIGGTAELYAIVGHMYAMLNNPLDKLDIPVAKMFDIADPADPDWHVVNISESTYLPITMDSFGVRWSSTMRMRPTRITRQWSRENGSWIKKITQQNRVESFGRPGVFHPIYKGEKRPYINPLSGWLDGLNVTMPDINIDFDVAGKLQSSEDWNTGWLFNSFGLSGLSNDWNGDLPEYEGVGTQLDGDIVAQCLDGGAGGDGYLIARSPGVTNKYKYSIYDNTNVFASPENWIFDSSYEPGEWTSGDPTGDSPVNIASNASQTMIVSVEPKDVFYQYNTGAGWSARANIGFANTTQFFGFGRVPPPIALDGTASWSVGRAAAGQHGYVVFKQSAIGGAWTELSNPVVTNGAGRIIRMIAHSGSSIFVSFPTPLSGDYLYRADDATVTWVDITPSGQYAPARYNAFVIDGTNIWMVGTNPDGGKKLFKSTNSGDNWTDLGETRYDWIYRLGSDNVFVLGGDSILDVSVNGLGTFHSRLGKWGSIGSIGVLQAFASKGLL